MLSRLLVLAAIFCGASAWLHSEAELLRDHSSDPQWPHFVQFQQKYGRNYASLVDERERFLIFRDNVKRAAALQARDKAAQWGVTQFMDLSPDEFREFYLMSNFSSPRTRGEALPILPAKHTRDAHVDLVHADIGAFDWSSRGVVTGIYDQGQCGSCWAFSATETVETQWAIAGHGLPNLSMQQLVDCDRQSGGCRGGDPPTAYNYIYAAGGQDSFGAYPYAGRDQTCHFNPGAVAARVRQWGYISNNDNEQAMLNWISSTGAPSACVCASQWQYYRGGVVSTQSGCCQQQDHCIQITGFGQYSGYNVWNVRNSWGAGWGENGYIYLEIGYNICGIGAEVTGVAVP